MKATAQEYDFHCRILAPDDPVAFVQLTEWLYPALVQHVQQRAGWNADTTLIEEAAIQALIEYHDAPTRYDPDRPACTIIWQWPPIGTFKMPEEKNYAYRPTRYHFLILHCKMFQAIQLSRSLLQSLSARIKQWSYYSL
jgi:hypothetical protein